ncbi:hypothetical protein BH18ACT7_BH18ACT7_15870 [soil metagenome]
MPPADDGRRGCDLSRALSEHEPAIGDVEGLVAGIRIGITRRTRRRRRAGIVAASLATAALVGGPAGLVTLSPQPVPAGRVLTASPTTTEITEQPLGAFAAAPDRLGFAVDAEPPGFAASEDITAPGSALRSYITAGADPDVLVVHRFEPGPSGVPTPVPTGGTVAVGDRVVDVLAGDPRGLGTYAVGWQPPDGGWLTVASSAPPEQARVEVLSLAATVRTDDTVLMTAPVQFSFLPPSLSLVGASRSASLDGTGVLRSTLWFGPQPARLADALMVFAEYDPASPEGPQEYQTGYSRGTDGSQNITRYSAGGWYLNLHAAPSLAEVLSRAELEEIANGIGIPSGALDVSEWNALPD